MNEDEATGPARDLRDEAADWFVSMRKPDGDGDRAQFERWLAADPLHRDAYNRIAEVFGHGKNLLKETYPAQSSRPKMHRNVLAVLCGLAIVMTFAIWRSARHVSPATALAFKTNEKLAFTTPAGSIRSWQLDDKSQITLDTDSAVQVAFTPTVRTLRLLHGRARFNVAHETRPFTVEAGRGTVTAHGTLFDVGIRPDGTVSVNLIRGAVDVALFTAKSSERSRQVLRERLAPGQHLIFDQAALSAPQTMPASTERWPEAILNCDNSTLAAIVAAANRNSTLHIVIHDPIIANLRVSGSFRIDDPQALAHRLATLFDLTVVQNRPTDIMLIRSQAER